MTPDARSTDAAAADAVGPNATAALEDAIDREDNARYDLRLYVTGMTRRSLRAIANIKQICEEHLQGRYDLVVIDVYQSPALARGEQIIALPTLIKRIPGPLRRFIGDLSDCDRVLIGLDLKPKH